MQSPVETAGSPARTYSPKEDTTVKASIDDSCIACGLCADVCPEVFEMPDDAEIAKVKVDEVPADAEASCREAAESCPVEAIQLEE